MKAKNKVGQNHSNPQDPTGEKVTQIYRRGHLDLEPKDVKTGLDILIGKAQAGDDTAFKTLNGISWQLDYALNPEQLPDPPLVPRDVPSNLPEISQKEIVSYIDAQQTYRIARADFEAKHSALVLKLLLGSKPEEGSCDLRLDKDCRIISTDGCSSGPPEVTRS